jgi:hypothetical protein
MMPEKYEMTALQYRRLMAVLWTPQMLKINEQHLQEDVEAFLNYGRVAGYRTMEEFLEHLLDIIFQDTEEQTTSPLGFSGNAPQYRTHRNFSLPTSSRR